MSETHSRVVAVGEVMIELARGNPEAPFVCVIADARTGEVVAEGLNDVERSPVLHGETAAIIARSAGSPPSTPGKFMTSAR